MKRKSTAISFSYCPLAIPNCKCNFPMDFFSEFMKCNTTALNKLHVKIASFFKMSYILSESSASMQERSTQTNKPQHNFKTNNCLIIPHHQNAQLARLVVWGRLYRYSFSLAWQCKQCNGSPMLSHNNRPLPNKDHIAHLCTGFITTSIRLAIRKGNCTRVAP